jgi:hypothetical protein
MPEVGILLPVRIETRFRDGGDLHIRVVPDEPWFARDDARISDGEHAALARYVDGVNRVDQPDEVQIAWRELTGHVGGARAVFLHRRFVTTGPDGASTVRTPSPDESRTEPALPRIVGFPEELTVWIARFDAAPEPVLTLTVDRSRLLADFADPDIPGDRRWWEDWDEAVAVGVAGVVPATRLLEQIDAVYVTGIGDGDPAELFGSLAAEGRLGLVPPGTPTNSVDGAPAASLGDDPATWWRILNSPPGAGDADVSAALTGDPQRLGGLPGGDVAHRATATALVTTMWPALWGFAAAHVWNVARGGDPARWARDALFPEGPFPTLRVGSQPYALLPTTAWQRWTAHTDDPGLEAALIRGLLELRSGHAERARAHGTVVGQSVDTLLDLIGHTPTSSRFRYRAAWPLELWWLAAAASGLPQRWRTFAAAWGDRHPLAGRLRLDQVRRYGARGRARLVGIPLVVPPGVDPAVMPDLLRRLADAAVSSPSTFANTARVDAEVVGRPADSLLLRLTVRSLQLLIADIGRERAGIDTFDPEPVSRPDRQRGRLEEHVASVVDIDPTDPTEAVQRLLEATTAVTDLADVRVEELERMLRAAIDTSSHRIDPWFVGVAQRRLDAMQDSGATRRLGAYGWVDELRRGTAGPTSAGLVHAPSAGQALTAAVLRDRAVNDTGTARWDLDITSRRARVADRIAEQVRVGAHLSEALGREIERVVGRTPDVERLRRDFPVRAEHAGRRVCDGFKVLAEDPFPVPLDTDQTVAVGEIREAIDTYGDLLVADAVFHLTEGRSEVAGAVMDGAAGLSRPPELALLRTPREGRAVSTSVLIALEQVEAPALPVDPAEIALVSPAAVLDPSSAAFLVDRLGESADWDLVVDRLDEAGAPGGTPRTVTLVDLGLQPADALALTRTDLERLATEAARDLLDLDPRTDRVAVIGGTAGTRYEDGSRLIGLIGRNPAGSAAVAERSADADRTDALTPLARRLLAARQVGEALADQLRDQTGRVALDGGIGTADAALLHLLVSAVRAWGIAPDPPSSAVAAASSAADARLRRLVASAVRALPQLEARLAAVPTAESDVRALGRDDLLAAMVALVSPTGQLAITGELLATALPGLERAELDAEWLTVAAAVRPALARLEVQQLSTGAPLIAWTNRPADPWQRDDTDLRRLVAVYAAPGLDLSALTSSSRIAVAALDRFSEVIPSPKQYAGAAFGFDAPAARPQQAILLAVPPDPAVPLDTSTLVDMLVETRALAHARMARPVDLAGEFWGLAPTALLPASGRAATPLEPSS